MENLDPKKSKLLNDFTVMAEGKNSDELVPLLFAFVNKAKKEDIHFSGGEINSLFESMKKTMSSEEAEKAEMLIKFVLK